MDENIIVYNDSLEFSDIEGKAVLFMYPTQNNTIVNTENNEYTNRNIIINEENNNEKIDRNVNKNTLNTDSVSSNILLDIYNKNYIQREIQENIKLEVLTDVKVLKIIINNDSVNSIILKSTNLSDILSRDVKKYQETSNNCNRNVIKNIQDTNIPLIKNSIYTENKNIILTRLIQKVFKDNVNREVVKSIDNISDLNKNVISKYKIKYDLKFSKVRPITKLIRMKKSVIKTVNIHNDTYKNWRLKVNPVPIPFAL